MNLSDYSTEDLINLYRQTEQIVVEYSGKSLAQKILLNSGYGALSNQFNRWYADHIAESVTLSGQMSIKWVEKHINLFLNRVMGTEAVDFVIAVDTDSLYIKLDDVVDKVFRGQNPSNNEILEFLEKFQEKLQEVIDAAIEKLYEETNVFDKKLSMAPEAIGPAIWVAAKRYIMSLPSFKKVRYDPPKIKMMGIDAVRSSTPVIVRKYIEDAIPLLIEGDDDKVKRYIDDKRADFYTKKWEDVAFPRGTNDLQKYANSQSIYGDKTPIHVRAALLYNHMLKEMNLDNKYPLIISGDKIRFCYMKMPNPIRENVFAAPDALPPEMNLEEFIDYEIQFTKTFLNPITKIINAAGINLSDNVDIDQFLL